MGRRDPLQHSLRIMERYNPSESHRTSLETIKGTIKFMLKPKRFTEQYGCSGAIGATRSIYSTDEKESAKIKCGLAFVHGTRGIANSDPAIFLEGPDFAKPLAELTKLRNQIPCPYQVWAERYMQKPD